MTSLAQPADDLPFRQAERVRQRLPADGLFAGQEWRISPRPLLLPADLVSDLRDLGRVLLQFYRAANRLYLLSAEGKVPPWVAGWLDQGKPTRQIELQRHARFRSEIPRVIRPDLLLTEQGPMISELDSVPGGIGLTAWLNRVYSDDAIGGLPTLSEPPASPSEDPPPGVIGGRAEMLDGFRQIFGPADRVHIVVSEESATYRPEMRWLAQQIDPERFQVRDAKFDSFGSGDAVYRFFELFDAENVPSAPGIFARASQGEVRLTAPPKAYLEEKMLLALLWNRNLGGFWRRELGEGFFTRLKQMVPFTWVLDPAPLPPHAAIPRLELTDWAQLKELSQRQRELVLKVSGYSSEAWGARGVFVGHDLPAEQWAAAVDRALQNFATNPYVLQTYHKPKTVAVEYADFQQRRIVPMNGRARLCPYYFVVGDGDQARAKLAGVLATVCPADKKIIHGMKDAVLAPCCA